MTRRGFTLLEVMISLAILAVGLVALSNLNGSALQMHAYSRRATQATLLLRGKMLDLEEELHKNGLSDFDDEKHGTFDGEGAPDYAWSAEILKPDVRLDPAQLMSLLGGAAGASSGQKGAGLSAAASQLAGALTGGGKGAGATGGNGMLAGPLGGMLTGQATTFIETLKKSVREVRLTVSWQDGKSRREVDASQLIVILPGSVGKTPEAAQGNTTADAMELQRELERERQGGVPGAPKLRLNRPLSSDVDSGR